MKRVGRWRSSALIGLALVGLMAGALLWLRYQNAGEPISPRTVLPEYGAGVASLEFFPDGKTLLSVGGDGSVRLWDANFGHLLQTKSFPKIVGGGVSISNDGRTVAINDYAELRLWNVSTGEIKVSKLAEMGMGWLYFSPDSRTIASVVSAVLKVPGAAPRNEYSICIWDVETGALLHTLDAPNKRWEGHVLYSPDSKKIVSPDGNAIKVWDVKTGALLHTLLGIAREDTIAFSPDRSHTAGVLAAVCDGPSTKAWDPKAIKVWDLETGALLHTLHTDGSPWSFKFSPDGKRIASVNYNVFNIRDTDANIWDVKTGARLHTSEVAEMVSPYILDYFPDGKSVLINPSSGSGEVWDVETGARLQRFRGGPLSRTYSRAGKKLISVKFQRRGIYPSARVEVWDAEAWKLLKKSKDSPDGVEGVAYSPDGTTLAFSLNNGEIMIWDLEEAAPAP